MTSKRMAEIQSPSLGFFSAGVAGWENNWFLLTLKKNKFILHHSWPVFPEVTDKRYNPRSAQKEDGEIE